jgi:hypothetical protein
MDRIKNGAIEIASVVMIYIPGFMKTGSGTQKLIWLKNEHTDRPEIEYEYIHFFNIKKVSYNLYRVHPVAYWKLLCYACTV